MENLNKLVLIPISLPDLVKEIANAFEIKIQNRVFNEPIKDRIGIKEAVELTGLKKSPLHQRTMADAILFTKFGKRLVFSRKELEAWMIKNSIPKHHTEISAISRLGTESRKKIK